MLPTINPSGQQFLDSLDNIQSRISTAEQQLSSGLKISQPSDAPDQISPILQLYSHIQQNQDIQTNLGTVQTQVNAGENALSSAVDLLQSASVIATQATGLDQTADTRATLAQNIQGIMSQMVAISNTTVEGRYVFSGDQDQTSLYTLDLSSPNGVDRAQVATNTRLVQGPGGAQFSASLSANDIFDHRMADDSNASDNVFAALNGLRIALTNNDTDGINTATAALQSASTYMNNELALYGQSQSRITSALDQTQNNDVQLRSQLSNLQDADAAQAATELTQGQTQLQAALEARARMPQTTLFDVLSSSGR